MSMKIIDPVVISSTNFYANFSRREITHIGLEILGYVKHVLKCRGNKEFDHIHREVWLKLPPHYIQANICIIKSEDVLDYRIYGDTKFYHSSNEFFLAQRLSFVQLNTGFSLN